MINLDFLGLIAVVLLVTIILSQLENIKKFFGRYFRGSREKERYVKICPKCGSIDVDTDYSNPAVWAYGTTMKYKCSSCSYSNTLFPEVYKENIANYQKNLRKALDEGTLQTKKWDLIDASTGIPILIFYLLIGLLFPLIFVPIILIAGGKPDSTTMFLFIMAFLFIVNVIYRTCKLRKSRKIIESQTPPNPHKQALRRSK